MGLFADVAEEDNNVAANDAQRNAKHGMTSQLSERCVLDRKLSSMTTRMQTLHEHFHFMRHLHHDAKFGGNTPQN
jgi:hypothetical protein